MVHHSRVRLIRAAVSMAVMTGATAVALQLSTGPAAADSALLLPITSVGDLVVDGPHQRIFLSDPIGGRVITTDYTGKVLATASGLTGVRDLLLSDRLYAAVPAAGTIVAFDPATSARVASYDTGGAPTTLAAAAGKIWFGEGRQGLGSLDLSGAEPVVVHRSSAPTTPPPSIAYRLWDFPPKIVASPTDPDVIATMELGSSASKLAILDVSTDPPTVLAHRDIDGVGGGGGGNDLAFSPDGSRVVVTAIQSTITALSSTDLSTIESYRATDAFPNAVAVRDDNTVAVVVGGKSTYEDNVAVYTPGAAAATKEFDLQQALDADGNPISLSLTQAARMVAWAPGGRRLFTVAIKSSSSASRPDPILTFQALNVPVKQLKLDYLLAPVQVEVGQVYDVSGTLAPTAPAGLPLVITRTDADHPQGVRVGPTVVNDQSGFAFQDSVTAVGTMLYTISTPGDDEFDASSDSFVIEAGVTRPTTLTLDRNGSTWAYGAAVTFTAKLGATNRSREVQIFADPAGSDQPKKMVKDAEVNAAGVLTTSLKLTRNTTVTAYFGGDVFTPEKTVKSIVYTRASVATTVTQQYKTGKIGSTSYYYFRKTKNPVFTTVINPYPGRKQYFQIDVYKGGKWVAWKSGYYPLSSAGKSARVLTGTHTTGVRYRVRSAYLSGKSGDTANATTYGSYRYFTFTK